MTASLGALRRRDLELLFGRCPEGVFAQALELGAGDGCQSEFLSHYCRRLLCTEYNEARLQRRSLPGVEYAVLDATDLTSLPEASFDLIFSSNLLEHLPEVEQVLVGLRRLLAPGGLALHCLPNPTWKALQFGLYPAMKARALAWRLGLGTPHRSPAGQVGNNPSTGTVQRSRGLDRLLPAHGQSGDTLAEFRLFSRSSWRSTFASAGYTLLHERELQFHSPYRLGCPEILRRGLSGLGLACSTAYILAPGNEVPANALHLLP